MSHFDVVEANGITFEYDGYEIVPDYVAEYHFPEGGKLTIPLKNDGRLNYDNIDLAKLFLEALPSVHCDKFLKAAISQDLQSYLPCEHEILRPRGLTPI